MFEVGKEYLRKEVSAKIGGEIVSYLTTSDGSARVNAGFFNLELDPLAPIEVQVGKKKNTVKKAETLIRQKDKNIFIFTKKKKHARISYVGEFIFVEAITDPTEIRRAEKTSGRIGGVTMLLRFVRQQNSLMAT